MTSCIRPARELAGPDNVPGSVDHSNLSVPLFLPSPSIDPLSEISETGFCVPYHGPSEHLFYADEIPLAHKYCSGA